MKKKKNGTVLKFQEQQQQKKGYQNFKTENKTITTQLF